MALAAPYTSHHVVDGWLDDFSPDSYLPMLRLAEPGDVGFLAANWGLEEAKRYRRLQRRMLRGYLRALAHDFQCLHSLAAEHAQTSALALVKEKMRFALSIRGVQARLLLNELVPCRVSLRPLLDRVNNLARRVREAGPRPA